MNEPRDSQADCGAVASTETSAAMPTLKTKFLSHGTLESRDLGFTRRFYTEFLGLQVINTSKISIWCRLGGQHAYAVIQTSANKKAPMSLLNHNGIDVETDADVDECHRLCIRDAEKWKLTKISKPRVQHGTYSFYFWDADENAWEILANPPGGYSWMFERGDQEGMGHLSRNFERPDYTKAAGR
jgi:catechol-2,3-dioxygenase